MNKRDIIKKFLGNDFQLDFASLEFFYNNQDKMDQFLQKIKNKGAPYTISLNFIQSVLKEPQIKILKTFKKQKRKISVQEISNYLNRKYEKLRKILLKNPSLKNLISINKISTQTKNFSLIGIVEEKDEENNLIRIEDTTGEVSIYFNKSSKYFQEIIPDDIIGLVCNKNDEIRAEEIIWPEVPLKRIINKTKKDVYCLFVSDFHMDSKDFNKISYEKFLEWLNKIRYDKFYLFVLGGISSRKDDITNFFDNLPNNSFKIFVKGKNDPDVYVGDVTIKAPSLLKIENKLVFLVCSGSEIYKYIKIWKDLPADKVMLNLIRRRQFDSLFDTEIYEEDSVLDVLPDVFASGYFQEPKLLNYKGTTIISTGNFISKPIFWLMNLRTREINKVDFT